MATGYNKMATGHNKMVTGQEKMIAEIIISVHKISN
jgi:hypothetical protein